MLLEDISKVSSIWDPYEFIYKLISIAVDRNVSDVHITPLSNEVIIRFRIAGELNNFFKLDNESFPQLVNVIKVNAGMDINKFKIAQDWKITTEIITRNKNKVNINLRVSTLPTIYWENIVMRVINSDKNILNIEKIGFSKHTLQVLRDIKKVSDGLILVAWSTWSWKTTTLYSILSNFDPFEKSIFTLEDPVEYQINWYVQSEVKKFNNEDAESFTFSDGLVWLLRQDPDIILIWELRRKEEAIISFEAANTWHLVLWSIHTNNSVSVIPRLKQLWVQPFLLASGLKYIISQKIVKKLCPKCMIRKDITHTDIWKQYATLLWKETLEVSFINELWCKHCFKWFTGSIIAAEAIKIDEDIKEILFKDISDTELKKILISKWFIPYYIDAVYKSVIGTVDFNDAISLEY